MAEIGFGLRYIALVHIIGHACLRTLQLLRAPTLLQDYHNLENAIGSRLPIGSTLFGKLVPARYGHWIYRFALERGYFDTILGDYIAEPMLNIFRRCNDAERRWTTWLSNEPLADKSNSGTPATLHGIRTSSVGHTNTSKSIVESEVDLIEELL